MKLRNALQRLFDPTPCTSMARFSLSFERWLSFTEKSGDRLRRQSEQAPSPAADVTFRYTGPDTRGLVLHPNLSRSGTGHPERLFLAPCQPFRRRGNRAPQRALQRRRAWLCHHPRAGTRASRALPGPSRPGLTSRGGLDLHNLQRVRSGDYRVRRWMGRQTAGRAQR
jgi:hypothetical protein